MSPHSVQIVFGFTFLWFRHKIRFYCTLDGLFLHNHHWFFFIHHFFFGGFSLLRSLLKQYCQMFRKFETFARPNNFSVWSYWSKPIWLGCASGLSSVPKAEFAYGILDKIQKTLKSLFLFCFREKNWKLLMVHCRFLHWFLFFFQWIF